MACRFAFFALFVLSALSCSNDLSSQESSTESSGRKMIYRLKMELKR